MANLLFIHGYPFDHTMFDAAAKRLARNHKVIAPDLPGFGGTPPLAIEPPKVRIDDFARFLLAALDKAKVDKFVPIGHSMGGYIAFALNRLAPKRIAGFALISSRSGADTDAATKVRNDNAARVAREGTAFLSDEMSRKPLAVDHPPDPALVTKLRAMIGRAKPDACIGALHAMATRPDSTKDMPKITVPALVIAGPHDAIVPRAESEALGRGFKNGRMVWCKRSGHIPMLEEPEVVTEALVKFADDV